MDISALRAQAIYEMDTKGVDAATADVKAFGDANAKAAQQADLLVRQTTVQEQSVSRVASKLEAATRKLDPYTKALAEEERLERLIAAHKANGGEVTEAHSRALDLAKQRTQKFARAQNDNAKSAALSRNEWINLSRQFQDVGTMAAMGMSPMQILTSQGAQIADVFSSSRGGAGAALSEFGMVALRVATNPLTILAAIAATSGYAFLRWKEQTDALTASLNGLGRQSGLTAAQASALAENAAASGGMSGATGRGLAGQYLAAGVPRAALGGAIGLTQDFSRRLGLPFEGAAQALSAALADPAKGADDLAQRFGLVTYAEREQIKQLSALGDKSGASSKLISILRDRIAEMDDPTWSLTKRLDGLKNAVSNSLDAWALLIEKGPVAYFSGQAQQEAQQEAQRKADEAARRYNESQAQERAAQLNKLREDSALSIRQTEARTFEERASVEMERARVAVMRDTNDAMRAAISSENKRNELIAEGNRKTEDMARAAADELALAGLSPYQRARMQAQQQADAAREQYAPGKEVVGPFATAGTAALNLADALNRAAGLVSHEGGRRIINVQRPGGSHAPYADIIAAEGTGRYGDPYNTSLGYMRSPKSLTSMTMDEALAWGDIVRRAQGKNSSAKGAFQIVNSTQRDAMRALGFSGSDRFDEAHQQAMADWIYQTQGIGAWEGFKRSGNAPLASAVNQNLGNFLSRKNKAIDIQYIEGPLKEAQRSIDELNRATETQAGSFGRNAGEIATLNERMRLYNEYARQSVDITPELSARIDEMAGKYGSAAQRADELSKRQNEVKAALDDVRSLTSSGLDTFVNDLTSGKKASDALRDSLRQVASQVERMAMQGLMNGLFGEQGKSGGGLFGNLLGGLFGGNSGPMQLPGATLSSGGLLGDLFGGLGKLWPFADGGMVTLAHMPSYASGGALAPGGGFPIIAHPGEIILNRAQQANVAGGMSPKVTIHNYAAGVQVQPQITSGHVQLIVRSEIAANNKRQSEADRRSA